MTVPDRPRRPRRADVRRRVLDAALEVFSERGYEASSMDQVAAHAGFTKGALYSNFSSKEELFLELMDQQVSKRVDTVAALQRFDPLDARSLGKALTDAALADRQWQLLFLDYWARAVRDPAVRPGFVAHRRRLHDRLADTIGALLSDAGVSTGLTKSQLATLVLALSNGVAIEGLVDPDGLPPDVVGAVFEALTDPRR